MAGVIGSGLPCTEAQGRPAQSAAAHDIAIPSLPLPAALSELSRQTGISIGTEGNLPAVRTQPVRGRLTPVAALRRMLEGTGLDATQVSPTAWRIIPASRSNQGADGSSAPLQARTMVDPVPIVVTAPRDREEWINTPYSIAVMLPGSVQQDNADSGTSSVTGYIDGVTFTGNGPGRNQMFLRGVADSPFSGSNQATVAVLLDGVRMTYSAPDPDLRLIDVKRVEVLKGPQGSLYGVGVLGGIYQIVTNPPDTSQTAAAIGIGSSLVAGGSLGETGSAMVNLPLIHDAVALRMVGYGSQKGGWVHTGARRDTNAVDTYGTRLGLGFDLGSEWRLDARGLIQRMDVADTQYVYQAGARSRPDQQPEPQLNELKHTALHLDGRLGGVDLIALSGMTWQESTDQRDATIGTASFGLANPVTYIDARRYRVWDSELHLSGQWGALSWLAGISHVEARRSVDRRLFTLDRATSLQVDAGHRTSIDSAVFGNTTLDLGKGFSLQAGGRLFRASVDDERAIDNTTHTLTTRQTGFTPAGALSWRPRDGRMLFVRYGSASRLGGLQIASSLFDPDCVEEDECGDVEVAKGDVLRTIEAGWRQRIAGSGFFDVSTFYTTWKNVQSDFLTSNGLTQNGNAGDARIIGAEAALNLPLGPWQLGLGGAYHDARLIDSVVAQNDTENGRLPMVPRFSARLSLKRQFPLGHAKAWLRTVIRYVGPSRLSFDPVLDHPMGNYLDAGVEGRITFDRFEIGVEAENLLGGSGDMFALGNQFRIATMRQYTPQVPPSVSMKIKARF